MENILIIGGNAAGLTAASRAKRLDPRLNVTVLEKGSTISYSTCGIPYFLAKMVTAEDLISYTPESFEKERAIKVHNNTRVDEIVPARKRVTATRTDTGERAEFAYDRLLIATGVKPKIPEIPGASLENVFTLTTLEDAMRINAVLASVQRVAIIGAGYVGLEMAECLYALGKTVHLYERESHVLLGMDSDMAQIIEYELQRFGVRLSTSAKVLALVGAQRLPFVVRFPGALDRHSRKCSHGDERARRVCSRQLRRNVLRNPAPAGPELHRNSGCQAGPCRR